MEVNTNFERIKLSDSKGNQSNAIRTVLKTGDVITCPATFVHIKHTLENMDQLQLKEDDVILTSYARSGTSLALHSCVSWFGFIFVKSFDVFMRLNTEEVLRNGFETARSRAASLNARRLLHHSLTRDSFWYTTRRTRTAWELVKLTAIF